MQVRRAEITAALSVAADAGMGHPPDLALSSSALAAGLARAADLSLDDVRASFDLALLRFAGCTADSQLAADAFGDEVAARAFMAPADFGSPASVLGIVARNLAVGRPWSERIPRFLRAVSKMGALFEAATAHCEVSQQIARSLGFDERTVVALGSSYERWDGRGIPKKLRREDVPIEVRVALLAHDVALYHRIGGDDAALAIARERSGSSFEPRLVAVLENHARELLDVLRAPSPWAAALEAEPRPHPVLSGESLEHAMSTLGHFADLKGRTRAGHSSAVSALATEAARRAGLDDARVVELRLAAHAHDLGIVATSATLWDKEGPLTDAEREAIRFHPYVGERCLARSEALGSVARLISLHHERLDGRGYPKGFAGESLTLAARVLAAADVAQAMLSPRPHRPARSPEEVARALETMCASGSLCAVASRAVIDAMGVGASKSVRAPAGGLTDRETEVLRLLAQGQTMKEAASTLGVAPKTIDNHVQRIYGKLGVTTRAAATMWAVRHGVVSTGPPLG